MRQFTSVFGALLAVVVVPLGAAGDEAVSETTRLVQQLGHEEFAVRERATERLTKMGLAAGAALEEGARNPDREIRYRSSRILAMIRNVDFQRRLEAFLAGRLEGGEAGLPGWDKFRELVGDQAETRSLFVEMQRAEPELMNAIAEGPKAAGNILEVRSQQLQQAMRLFQQQLSLGNVSALLFAATDKEVAVSTQAASTIYGYCYQPAFSNAITNGSRRELLRKLLGTWIRRSEGWSVYQGLALAMQYELPDGLVAAERALTDPFGQTHIQQYAILTVAKLGGEEHLPLLEKQMENRTRCSLQRIGKVNYETQIRDVALAAALHVLKQDPLKFGFSNRLQRNNMIVFNTNTLGFEDDEKRGLAFQKWREFRAAPPTSQAPASGDSQ